MLSRVRPAGPAVGLSDKGLSLCLMGLVLIGAPIVARLREGAVTADCEGREPGNLIRLRCPLRRRLKLACARQQRRAYAKQARRASRAATEPGGLGTGQFTRFGKFSTESDREGVEFALRRRLLLHQ